MSLHDEGKFPGTITRFGVESDPLNDDGMVLAFHVELEDGAKGVCRHATSTPKNPMIERITRSLVEDLFGLTWPDGIQDLYEMVGNDVTVKIKHRQGTRGGTFENWYLTVPGKGGGRRGEQLEGEAVAAAIRRLRGEDDESPLI